MPGKGSEATRSGEIEHASCSNCSSCAAMLAPPLPPSGLPLPLPAIPPTPLCGDDSNLLVSAICLAREVNRFSSPPDRKSEPLPPAAILALALELPAADSGSDPAMLLKLRFAFPRFAFFGLPDDDDDPPSWPSCATPVRAFASPPSSAPR